MTFRSLFVFSQFISGLILILINIQEIRLSSGSQKPLPIFILGLELILVLPFHHFRHGDHSISHGKMTTHKISVSAHQTVDR